MSSMGSYTGLRGAYGKTQTKLLSVERTMSFLWQGLYFMISVETLLMGFLTVVFIFIVSEGMLDISFNVEFTVFSAGCIFPTTFSVEAAFERKETALNHLARLKATLTALFSQFVHFDRSENYGGLGPAAAAVRPIFARLVDHIEAYCRATGPPCLTLQAAASGPAQLQAGGGRNARPGSRAWAGHAVYDELARLGDAVQTMSARHFGRDPARATDQATSRSWAFLGEACVAWEGLVAIRSTDTPRGMRLFSYFLVNLSCLALAPFWAHFCKKERLSPAYPLGDGLVGGGAGWADAGWAAWPAALVVRSQELVPPGSGCASAYLIGVLFTFIVLTLYRVQQHLGEALAGNGRDDVPWDQWRQQLDCLGLHGPDGPVRRAPPPPNPASLSATN